MEEKAGKVSGKRESQISQRGLEAEPSYRSAKGEPVVMVVCDLEALQRSILVEALVEGLDAGPQKARGDALISDGIDTGDEVEMLYKKADMLVAY
ncbi:hypothetical protein DSL72_006202 [Monilinia vaccinii-corymbosi]|uniref:Uncharacterized protein n=1 Tax=Monilinia vaccinii-corymbosi TaxID=61207 RepID=A0A8A3PH93_9HELO|nr:hypothetical protein DSL72_006202 [Monilinia vaccinii-corymbosi]